MRDNSDTQDVESNQNEVSLIEFIRNSVVDVDTMAYLMIAAEYGEPMVVTGESDSSRKTTMDVMEQFVPSHHSVCSIEDGEKFFKRLNAGHRVWSDVEADSAESALQQVGEEVHNSLISPLNLVIALDEEGVVEMSEVCVEDEDKISTKQVTDSGSGVLKNIQIVKGWSEEQLQTELDERKAVIQYCVENNDTEALTDYLEGKHGDGDLKDTQIGTVIQEAL